MTLYELSVSQGTTLTSGLDWVPLFWMHWSTSTVCGSNATAGADVGLPVVAAEVTGPVGSEVGVTPLAERCVVMYHAAKPPPPPSRSTASTIRTTVPVRRPRVAGAAAYPPCATVAWDHTSECG
jgi:hypothetical protein